jgi:hypothetical protein
MKKSIMILLIAGILLTGALPILQEIQPDLIPDGKGGTGSGPTPGEVDFCGDLFNPLNDGSSPDGGGGTGGGPTPG